MMSSIIILKSKQDAQLAEKVRTINVVHVQSQQNGSDYWVMLQAYIPQYYIPKPNVLI